MAGVSHLHPESSRVRVCVRDTKSNYVCSATSYSQHNPRSWVHLCILMSPRICIVEKYLCRHFVAARLVWVHRDTGWNGRRPPIHLFDVFSFFFFCSVVLKGTRTHNRRLSAGLIIISGSRKPASPVTAPSEVEELVVSKSQRGREKKNFLCGCARSEEAV